MVAIQEHRSIHLAQHFASVHQKWQKYSGVFVREILLWKCILTSTFLNLRFIFVSMLTYIFQQNGFDPPELLASAVQMLAISSAIRGINLVSPSLLSAIFTAISATIFAKELPEQQNILDIWVQATKWDNIQVKFNLIQKPAALHLNSGVVVAKSREIFLPK